jgi:hypothetical protein
MALSLQEEMRLTIRIIEFLCYLDSWYHKWPIQISIRMVHEFLFMGAAAKAKFLIFRVVLLYTRSPVMAGPC